MPAPGGHPTTVLVADDDDLVRTVLRLALVGQGHTVIEARDSLSIAAIDPQVEIALAILDLSMPGGTAEANLDVLDARVRPPRVLILSGAHEPPPAVAARTHAFARKPLDLTEFRTLIGRLLAEPRAQDST